MKFHQNRSTLRPCSYRAKSGKLTFVTPGGGNTGGERNQKYMKRRILSIQHTYMKAHMDWSNGVQDKGGQTCGRHPPTRLPAAGHSDYIIPRHLIWRGTKKKDYHKDLRT